MSFDISNKGVYGLSRTVILGGARTPFGKLGGAFLANSNSVINGVGGIVVLFGVLFVLYVFAQRVWKLRSFSPNTTKKPPKSKRKSSAVGNRGRSHGCGR